MLTFRFAPRNLNLPLLNCRLERASASPLESASSEIPLPAG